MLCDTLPARMIDDKNKITVLLCYFLDILPLTLPDTVYLVLVGMSLWSSDAQCSVRCF